jgi:hypothetical protein
MYMIERAGTHKFVPPYYCSRRNNSVSLACEADGGEELITIANKTIRKISVGKARCRGHRMTPKNGSWGEIDQLSLTK